MLKVHHLENSRSQRILWLLEELNLPYELIVYKRDPITLLAPPELKQIHALGKSPIVEDNNLVLAESGMIIEYIVDKYAIASFKPKKDSQEFINYKFWLHYAEGSLMPPLLLNLIFDKVQHSPAPFFIKPIIRKIINKVKDGFLNQQLKIHLDYIESFLSQNKWFAGDIFTAADIQMSYPLEAAKLRGLVDLRRPNILRFIESIYQREAYIKAVEHGGGYQAFNK